jgi:hypothetical protein
MFRTYVAMGLMALGVFTYVQYAGLSVFAASESRPAPGQQGAVHK